MMYSLTTNIQFLRASAISFFYSEDTQIVPDIISKYLEMIK